jgi:hypothetical protein
MLKNGNKQANGGKRQGAGRKPKAATILKRRMIENKIEEAEASFAYWVAVRDNEKELSNIRLEASKLIWEHLMGKPTQPIGQDPKMPFSDKTITLFVHNDNSAS